MPRRTFLRGVGATVALPFLDAMVPAATMSRPAAVMGQRMQRTPDIHYVPTPIKVVDAMLTVAAVGPNHYGMDLHLPENAFRFKRWIAERQRPHAGATRD